jgi:hypothetical protein
MRNFSALPASVWLTAEALEEIVLKKPLVRRADPVDLSCSYRPAITLKDGPADSFNGAKNGRESICLSTSGLPLPCPNR